MLVQNTRAQQLTLLTGLYAAQGLPFGFFTLALPVLLREAGWSLTAISFLQFLALPWALKFMWAPVLDHHGTRRGWLLGLQCAACATALLLSQLNLQLGSIALFTAVFAFNLIAATQDVVTDGLAVRLLNAKERGLANAIQVGAYRLGMILGGGLLLWVFARSNWSVMFLCMAAMLAITVVPVLTLREPPPPAEHHTRPGGWRLAIAWVHRALRPGMAAIAGLIFCYRFGDQMVSSLIVPFLSDQGLGKETIAGMKGAVGSATSLLGAVIGGWLTFRVGRRQALLFSGLAQALGFGFYIAAAMGVGGVELLWAATIVEGLVGTMASVALFALMMDASDPLHAGTDYTLLASVVVLVSSLGGIAGGLAGDLLGYAPAFAIGTVLAAMGCVFVVYWLDRHHTHERVAQAWR
ncbi:MAG: MFS transporter [Leptothrix sp. (in: Bacteria)]|nr:MFS transporter [Leptothrix sp. (in: b-proteobacteria)]